MIEKLLENWLDKASELSYQPVFVQMLAAEGYQVLHSTRHCLLEFGKDILAIAPDGVGCAFQLKGDPGGRMSISEFRSSIQFQLVQLMSQAPAYPGFPTGTHRSYLVSNGEFNEEVQTAVQSMNNTVLPSKLELWSRGTLLDMCLRTGQKLWPGEVADTKALLELYMLDPRGKPPVRLLDGILESILGLQDGATPLGKSEFVRAASSAAWSTGLAMASFAEAGNHYAVAVGWTQCCVALIAAAEKHPSASLTQITTSFNLAKAAVLDALAALWKEIEASEHLGQGDPLTDRDILGWRVTVLFGLLTSLAIADGETSILEESSRNSLHQWLKRNPYHPELWGEAAVASLVPWVLWIRKNDATNRPDDEIATLASVLITTNQPDSEAPLMSPYYDGEEVLTKTFGLSKNIFERGETFAGSSFTSEVAMHLLVRAGLKQKCKTLWADFTRLNHRRLEFANSWDYCRIQARQGVEDTKIYPSTYAWRDLKKDVFDLELNLPLPAQLSSCAWLQSMWWQAAPQRMTTDSVRALINCIVPGWGT